MNSKVLVRISNIIGVISIIALVYWVFTFITIQVFGLKVFREHITETFYMSIMGILALMFGALIINLMFNLTRIAQKHNNDEIYETKPINKKLALIFFLTFPSLFILLFLGNHLTVNKKERFLIQSAESVIMQNPIYAQKITNYAFTTEWVDKTSEILKVLNKTDMNFKDITVITCDSLDQSRILLGFTANYYMDTARNNFKKNYFIFETSQEERAYLYRFFDSQENRIKFDANDGNYKLFYPHINGNQRIVFLFSDFQRYGKLGS